MMYVYAMLAAAVQVGAASSAGGSLTQASRELSSLGSALLFLLFLLLVSSSLHACKMLICCPSAVLMLCRLQWT